MEFMTCPNCGNDGIPAKSNAIMPLGESEKCRECGAYFEIPSYLVLIISFPLIAVSLIMHNVLFGVIGLIFIFVISVLFYRYMPLKQVAVPRNKFLNLFVSLPLLIGIYLVTVRNEFETMEKLSIFLSGVALTAIFDYIYVWFRRK